MSQEVIERWAAEDAELGAAGAAFHAETLQALRDARAVAPETVDPHRLEQLRSIFPGARSLANPESEVESPPLATIGVGRSFGDEPRDRFYVIAVDIFPEYVEVSFEGDPGAAASTDWSRDVKALFAAVVDVLGAEVVGWISSVVVVRFAITSPSPPRHAPSARRAATEPAKIVHFRLRRLS